MGRSQQQWYACVGCLFSVSIGSILVLHAAAPATVSHHPAATGPADLPPRCDPTRACQHRSDAGAAGGAATSKGDVRATATAAAATIPLTTDGATSEDIAAAATTAAPEKYGPAAGDTATAAPAVWCIASATSASAASTAFPRRIPRLAVTVIEYIPARFRWFSHRF